MPIAELIDWFSGKLSEIRLSGKLRADLVVQIKFYESTMTLLRSNIDSVKSRQHKWEDLRKFANNKKIDFPIETPEFHPEGKKISIHDYKIFLRALYNFHDLINFEQKIKSIVFRAESEVSHAEVVAACIILLDSIINRIQEDFETRQKLDSEPIGDLINFCYFIHRLACDQLKLYYQAAIKSKSSEITTDIGIGALDYEPEITLRKIHQKLNATGPLTAKVQSLYQKAQMSLKIKELCEQAIKLQDKLKSEIPEKSQQEARYHIAAGYFIKTTDYLQEATRSHDAIREKNIANAIETYKNGLLILQENPSFGTRMADINFTTKLCREISNVVRIYSSNPDRTLLMFGLSVDHYRHHDSEVVATKDIKTGQPRA